MRSLVEFLKTSAIGGLFVLVPILLLYLLFAEALDLVVAMAEPIADLFPKGTFDQIRFPVIMALLLIVGISFLTGLALRLKVGKWIERNMFSRLPAYNALRGLTQGFVDAGKDGAFRSAVLNSSDGERTLVYVIEDHADGSVTVLVPWAPTAFSGSVKIVGRDRIEFLDATLGDVSRVFSQWGVGARELLGKNRMRNGATR